MTISILIMGNGNKQIMLTPENETEESVLTWIEDGEIHVELKAGSFSNSANRFGMNVRECKAGYFRAFESDKSLMIKLTPKSNIKQTT